MSGVASKLCRLQRSRSLSSRRSKFLEPKLEYGSVRRLHGSILNPRAPKIRHLNSSHALLIDLDKHIAKVQELEIKVYEMEQQLQLREAAVKSVQSIQKTTQPLPPLADARLKTCLVTEEDRTAFQNRLVEAKKKTEILSLKRNQEESNILRSWHSKKLKQVLDEMNGTDLKHKSLKLLAAPAQVVNENRIFSSLDALVEIVNEEGVEGVDPVDPLHLDNPVDQLKHLVIEKEKLKEVVDSLSLKLARSTDTRMECEIARRNIEISISALELELSSSRSYLGSILSRQQNTALWIYGPNPIFSGVKEYELGAAFQNQFAGQLLKKMEISRLHAINNVAYATNLVAMYRRRLVTATSKLGAAEARIDAQVEVINRSEDSAATKPFGAVKVEIAAKPEKSEDSVLLPN